MQKIIVFLLVILSLNACQSDRKGVEFKRIDNLDLGNLSKGAAKMKGTAIFTNLSDDNLTIKDMILDFSVDGKDVGTIVTKSNNTVAGKSEFSVPFQYSFDTDALKVEGHDASSTYAVLLKGTLTLLDANKKEVKSELKFSTSYEYKTNKEIRQDKRDDRKEKREQRREERKAKRNN
jgi:hypothetical protein